MSTNLFEGERVQVTRFACGRCREKGPCFQITGIGVKNGDYVVVHRDDVLPVSTAMLGEVIPTKEELARILAQER